MPFTLAHPAAILPLYKRGNLFSSFSALCIGSMSPDFIYFLPLEISRHTTHTFAALFWFCLPLGLIAYFLFHHLLKLPLWFILPQALRKRLQPFAFNNQTIGIKQIAILILCILAGAATHLIWDLFTHPSVITESWLPFLSTTLYEGHGQIVKVYRLLQHGSNTMGFIVLGVSLKLFLQIEEPAVEEPLKWANSLRNGLRLTIILSILFVGVYSGLAALEFEQTTRKITYFVRYFIVNGMNAALTTILLAGLGWILLKQKHSTDASE